MTIRTLGHRALRLAAVLGLAGLAVACASPQNGPMVAPAGYGKDDTSRVERLVQYCDRLAEKGEYMTALGLCGRAHEIDPDNPETLMKMASILTSLNRTQAAAQAYGVLLERHPRHLEARYKLGKLHMADGETTLAAMHFNQAITANPEDPRAYNALGILRDQAGEHQEAQSLYRSALEHDPKNMSVRNNLGLSLALSGQRDQAIDVLAELAVDPGADQTVMRNLEIAYATQTAPAAAPGVAREAVPAKAEHATVGPAEALPGEPAPVTEPVEVEARETPPDRPRTLPARSPTIPAPSMGAPEVKATPADPADGKPTPLYRPKPSAAAPAGDGSFAARSLAARTEAPEVVTTRRAAPAASEGASLIDSAAAELMKKPDWADFEPGSLMPSDAPQEASLAQPAPADAPAPSASGGLSGFVSGSVFADG